MKKQIWMAAAAALAVSACGENAASNSAEDATESAPTENIKATSERIYSVYENNQLDAEEKFSNKNITVAGLFRDVRKIGDKRILTLASLEQGYDGRPQVSALKGVDVVISDADIASVAQADSGDLVQITCSKWGDSPSPWALLEECRGFEILEGSGYPAATRFLQMVQDDLAENPPSK